MMSSDLPRTLCTCTDCGRTIDHSVDVRPVVSILGVPGCRYAKMAKALLDTELSKFDGMFHPDSTYTSVSTMHKFRGMTSQQQTSPCVYIDTKRIGGHTEMVKFAETIQNDAHPEATDVRQYDV